MYYNTSCGNKYFNILSYSEKHVGGLFVRRICQLCYDKTKLIFLNYTHD